VLEVGNAPARLQDGQVTGQIAVLVGEGILDGVTNAGLGGHVDDATGVRLPYDLAQGRRVGDVRPHHSEAGVRLQPRDTRLLQADVVVIGEIVDPDDFLTAIEKPFGHMHADEPRSAGDDHRHLRHVPG
jgi:hypothetical protein